jgi:hypothetical protein
MKHLFQTFDARFAYTLLWWRNTLISFLTASTGVPGWHRPNFRLRQGGSVKRLNLFAIFQTNHIGPQVEGNTPQLQISYNLAII